MKRVNAWKADKSAGSRRAQKAKLARCLARHAFKAGMQGADALCNEFLNTKEKFENVKNWFDDKRGLEPDFFYYAYYKYREIKYKESMFTKYRGMAELYREICISQEACADARERRQSCSFPGAARAKAEAQPAEPAQPTARALRAEGRV